MYTIYMLVITITTNSSFFSKTLRILVFVMEVACGLCEAGNEFLNIITYLKYTFYFILGAAA